MSFATNCQGSVGEVEGYAFQARPVNHFRQWVLCASVSIALSTGAIATNAAEGPFADVVMLNGEIVTMDPGQPSATALAIRGAHIVQVGANAQARSLVGPRTRVIDLQGHTVVPGLVDSHIHGIRGGQSFDIESYWYDYVSLSDALKSLQDAAAQRGSGKWIAVVGSWHPAQFRERRGPTKDELDTVLPGNPAYVQFLYNTGQLNQQGIDALGLDTDSPQTWGLLVERDAKGKATGKVTGSVAAFSGLFARISARSEIERRESLRRFFTELNKRGVTAIVDPAAGDGSAFDPLFNLWRRKELTLRVGYRVSSLARVNEEQWFRATVGYMPPRFGDGMLRFVGIGENLVAGMYDGVRQGPGFTASALAKEELGKIANFAAERGYQIEIHAYTDDSANQILDVFEAVSKRHVIGDLRWAIAHINSGKRATFERMKRLGIAYTVQMGPYYEADTIEAENGPGTAERSPPIRDALALGVPSVGGTDSTRIGEINVWRAIEFHVSGRAIGNISQRSPEKVLTRLEALQLYTTSAAWLTFDEGSRGALSVGKEADLAVLNAPFLLVATEQIHRIRSILTLVGGRVVHWDARFGSPPP